MSDKKREFVNVNTSDNVTMPVSKKEEPGLPVKIPLSIVRWICYSAGFACLLVPFNMTYWQLLGVSLILGHFASQLNAIIKK
jgi:hypothetical protein